MGLHNKYLYPAMEYSALVLNQLQISQWLWNRCSNVLQKFWTVTPMDYEPSFGLLALGSCIVHQEWCFLGTPGTFKYDQWTP